ncbi:MAG: ADP-heptose:LPS heptosyltransferase II [Ignavibacteria bacterium]|nr:MAG: ADP-heptose:LPS heptosyltransferase II [Ignavibacteria bacterium]KAF0161857.1 MAG: ADP-heptose:LPS heptosyltransferase II [Ignavibacteria bacterium]
MKILIIALSGIGDALMFTPALAKLREAMPSAKIDALVMFNGVKDIFDKLPYLNQVHFFDFMNARKAASLFYILSLWKKYDTTFSVYPSNRKEYNLMSFLIGAKYRFGIKYKRSDFLNFGFLNNIRCEENDNSHNVETNFMMVEKLLAEQFNNIPSLKFCFQQDDLIYSSDFLKEKNISSDDLVIGFHPGCNTLKNHDKRRWEVEKFAELAKLLIEKHNAKILVFGGGEEEHLKEGIVSIVNSNRIISVQTFSLTNTAAIMKRCNIFVSNDSSLMHIAAALQLKVVSIIGPTNEKYISPWKTNHEIASLNLECSPCFFYSPKILSCSRKDIKFKCIKELPVKLVYEKTLRLL